MTDIPAPDEMTPAELKLHTRLMILSPSRQQRAARVRKAIEQQGKAKTPIAVGKRGPITFAHAFAVTYGEEL